MHQTISKWKVVQVKSYPQQEQHKQPARNKKKKKTPQQPSLASIIQT